jgi:hypothetical protein
MQRRPALGSDQLAARERWRGGLIIQLGQARIDAIENQQDLVDVIAFGVSTQRARELLEDVEAQGAQTAGVEMTQSADAIGTEAVFGARVIAAAKRAGVSDDDRRRRLPVLANAGVLPVLLSGRADATLRRHAMGR